MNKIAIGCQTITYGDPQQDRFAEIFDEVSRDGYAGVEIGYRRLQHVPSERVAQLLSGRGLSLLGGHVGGNLDDPSQASKERSVLEEVVAYLRAAGTERLMYSGLRFENEGQFRHDLEMIFRSAELCRSSGIRLLYHNHDWEFAEDWRVYSRLLEEAPEDLHFCVDVGWVEKAGVDALEVLAKVGGRLEVVHFKDFATTGNREMDTVVLGTGAINLGKIASWLSDNAPHDIWVVAEQDVAQGSVSDAVRGNAEYLKSVFRSQGGKESAK